MVLVLISVYQIKCEKIVSCKSKYMCIWYFTVRYMVVMKHSACVNGVICILVLRTTMLMFMSCNFDIKGPIV